MSLLSEVKVFDLPTKTATKILKEYIEKDTGRKVKSIKFITGNQIVGYGMVELAFFIFIMYWTGYWIGRGISWVFTY